MDQFSRRIIGFSVCKVAIKTEDLCDIFYKKFFPYNAFLKRISTDYGPLFESLIWKINLADWGLNEIKSAAVSTNIMAFLVRDPGTIIGLGAKRKDPSERNRRAMRSYAYRHSGEILRIFAIRPKKTAE